MMQSQQTSPLGLNISGIGQGVQRSPIAQHGSVSHQQPFMMSPPASSMSSTQPSPTHQIFNRIKTEQKVSPDMMQREPMQRSWKQPEMVSNAYGPQMFGSAPGSFMEPMHPSTSHSQSTRMVSTHPVQQQAQQASILEHLINSPQYGSQPAQPQVRKRLFLIR